MAKRCLGCMKLKENSPICEHCGYNENVPNYPNQLPVGMLLHGQYTVGKVLGQGGFGITYIGWDNSLETVVAIKEFYPSGVVNRDIQYSQTVSCNGKEAEVQFGRNRERFLKEARILAKLQNVPGVVRVQNLFSENNTVYIVMEYVQGIDLRQYLRMHNRSMTAKEVLTILRPVLYALHKVHGAGLIHRDIAPDNIMILPDGTAKLLDFGAAREVEPGQAVMESTEAILKHGFAPIEQYSRRGNLGPWTDVYALCATIYYCLTGKLPDSAAERVMGEDNVDWRNIPDLTDKQIQILEKGMALRPEDRIQSMEELYHGLFPQQQAPAPKPEQVPPQQPAVAPKPEKKQAPQPKQEKKQKPQAKQKKKALPVIGAAAVVAIAAAAVLLLPKSNAEKPTVAVPEMTLPAAVETTVPVETVNAEDVRRYEEAEALAAEGKHAQAGIAFAKLGDFQDARERSFEEWGHVRKKQTISVGSSFYADYGIPYLMGLRNDGTAVLTGPSYNQCQSVADWTDLVGVCMAGESVPLAVKADGTVVSGSPIILVEHMFDYDMEYFQEQIGGWTDIIALYERANGVYGLKRDGTVVYASFYNNPEQIQATNDELSRWTDVVDILDGCGLRSDGTMVSYSGWNWGDFDSTIEDVENVVSFNNAGGATRILYADGTVGRMYSEWDNESKTQKHYIEKIEGLTDVISVQGNAALKSDGTVTIFASDADSADYNKWWDKIREKSKDWEDITEIYYLCNILCGLREDGTVAVAGQGYLAETVRKWTDIAHITGTYDGILGIKKDSTIVMCGEKNTDARKWTDIQIP